MLSPIHRFFDGTRIDMSQVLDISVPQISNPKAPKGDLMLEFSITYKGKEQPRAFSYSLKEAVDTQSLGHSLCTAYWDGIDGIEQIALDALGGRIEELVSDWADFRTTQLVTEKH